MVPRAVLMKTGLKSVNTARPVTTTHPKTTVYSARPMSHFSKSAQSIVKRPYQIRTTLTNKTSSQKVNTAKVNFYTARQKAVNTARPNSVVVNAVRANQVNVVKASACWVWRPTKLNSASSTLKRHNYGHPQKEDQGYVDSGYSRHMTRNMTYLAGFMEFDRGYVTFGGGATGGKITGKGTLKTDVWTKEQCFFFTDTRCLYSQNGVVQRRNRTLIEAARTMLADSKLPTTFWAEAINTACYVQNRDYLGKFDEKGDGPKWFIDIDVLTKSMNYVPVIAGTNSNDLVGTEESIGAGHSSKETGSSHDYILMPLWKDGSLFDSSLKNDSNDETLHSSDARKKDDEGICKESRIADQEKSKNSTQGVNTTRLSINTKPDIFSLGDNATLEATHADFFGDETEVDMSNITTTYLVLSTPNTRIHKDHSLNHVIGDEEPKKGNLSINRSKLDRSYARRDFAVQVTTGLDLGGYTTWQKSHCILQGYTQEEGIDYDEVFALVARIEAIRLFLAYIEKEVYVCRPLGFEDPEFPNRVYKVEKALYSLHQAPRACQDKYVDEILKKFGFSTIKTASTPMETLKPLLKDAEAEDVDVHLYRSMIGSLMYLTSSRPNIMFDDSPFDLEAYFDSDYAVLSLDRKSTTGGCQFLGSRLILWQCKKQTIVANSTTEAEYVAAASCCG
ncbi:putative ribonuclease H-like domain-containing protein [Tanacetum coccineum]